MFLERIEVTGYRGISRLSAAFGGQTALIGENSWGKSSLLRLLWCVLGNGEVPYRFTREDFRRETADYVSSRYGNGQTREKEVSVALVFREIVPGSAPSDPRLKRLAPAWVRCEDSFYRVFYYLRGVMDGSGAVSTRHDFLDAEGNILRPGRDMSAQVGELLALNPVFRIRDRRRGEHGLYDSESAGGEESPPAESLPEAAGAAGENPPAGGDAPAPAPRRTYLRLGAWEKLKRRLPVFAKGVMDTEGEVVPGDQLRENLEALNILFEHYFTVAPPLSRSYRRRRAGRDIRDIVLRPVSNDAIGSLGKILGRSSRRSSKIILTLVMASFVDDLQGRAVDAAARPILILEDIESRLHPTVLLSIWNIIDLMPMQKIITTNSGDLLSAMPLGDVRRMYRTANSVECRGIDEKKFTGDEMRRIAFHVRINRPMSLFARAWIFVEGETEIWLLNEFASILGIGLQSEGVRLVEYAQCGAGPLIKLADQLGIFWHLIADGDEAGIKYARNAGGGDGPNPNVTLLPAVDIEHFLFESGFADVYRRGSGLTSTRNVSRNKIIGLAIKRKSKPGMALAVVDEARRRGKKSVPKLLQTILVRARSEAANRC